MSILSPFLTTKALISSRASWSQLRTASSIAVQGPRAVVLANVHKHRLLYESMRKFFLLFHTSLSSLTGALQPPWECGMRSYLKKEWGYSSKQPRTLVTLGSHSAMAGLLTFALGFIGKKNKSLLCHFHLCFLWKATQISPWYEHK